MCTVTIFPTPDSTGFRLLANRDELHARPGALPPERREHGGVGCVYPVDPAGGGTWVGVNERGVAATLLNLNPDPPAAKRDDHQTRGRLVPMALGQDTARGAADALQGAIDPAAQLPFRLVVADVHDVVLLRSDGESLTREDLGPSSGQWFTSSGLGDHVVQGPREAVYGAAFDGLGAAEAYAAQDAFHQQRDEADTPRSVRMMRGDARTVSVTSVVVTPDGAELVYTPVDRGGVDGEAVAVGLPLVNPSPALAGEGSGQRRRVRWWWVYLALLLASWVMQAVVTPWPGYGPRDVAELPAMGSGGAIDGRDLVRFSYRIHGDPDAPHTVVALPGSPGFGDNFAAFAPHLIELVGDDFRLVSLDYPGTGAGSRWVPDYGADAFAHYTLALMDELGVERAHVLGYSYGGAVATRMTGLAPERFESMVFYGGIGAQAAEGTGDYHFEHLKYAVAYLGVVVLPELLPHFGLLGDRADRHAFARNFWDLDQRPYAAMLDALDDAPESEWFPVLLVNGHDDPLVRVDAARLHHDLIEHSELVITDGGHGDILFDPEARSVAAVIGPWLREVADGEHPAQRADDDPYLAADRAAAASTPTERIGLRDGWSPWLKLALIAAATFVSEDLTCIYAGLLANHGQLDLTVAVLGCFLGIFIGDVALFLIGRLAGARVLRWRPVRKWAPTETLDELGRWYERYGFVAVFASRFMPGTRLPLYVTAGVVKGHARKFVLWAAISDVIYTPAIVVLVAVFGDRVAGPLTAFFGKGWIGLAVAALLLFFALRVLVHLLSHRGRQKLAVKWTRLRHHEWWPAKLFYLPMLPVWAWLAVRHRSVTAWTAANPAMPDGGLVEESKAAILAGLPGDAVLAWTLLPAGGVDRAALLASFMAAEGLGYPVVLKPDVGERGVGVKVIRDAASARAYLAEEPGDVVAQAFDPGPFEAGVFYVRDPGAERGEVFSVTDKVFPVIEGNGADTLEELVWSHPRYRCQADLFLHRFHERRQDVLGKGETLRLAQAGNHAQGCEFVDGAHLLTDELAASVDAIARRYEGFFFGRFDFRYADAEAFQRGEGLRVIEVNGVSSEATNHYDPSWSAWRAYRQLARQWAWAFRIGSANAARGHKPSTVRHLLRVAGRALRGGPAHVVAD